MADFPVIHRATGFIFFACVLILMACGDSSTEKVMDGRNVVSDVAGLPPCEQANEGEQVLVTSEGSTRVCADGKWFSIAGDTLYEQSGKLLCETEKLSDNSGIKIICNGDSVGVVFNGQDGKDGSDGADGAPGQQGPQGYKGFSGADGKEGPKGEKGGDGAEGVAGADGASCTLKTIDELSVRVYCGEDSVTLYIGEMPDTTSVGTVALDSEKVAISLDDVSGVTQKGPFLSGSKVRAYEIADGRSLKQTGNVFNGKIMDDNGEFKINARMLVSQYVSLEATGFYRNEVTGVNSNAELTLFAITDVSERSVANMNLLTHLEYERVKYLVTQKKMKVKNAKKQAQKEIFGILLIDATDFSNSEDLNIAGSSDEDGALLAFSVMFQGDRTVAELSELLTKISKDMETDGSWDDADARMKIAEWSADADSAGRLAVIRSNVKNWGISAMVPNFEKYIRNFWYTEYGLGECTADSADTLKQATAGKRKDTKTRYICKADSVGEFHWEVASDFEKDTHLWDAGEDGEFKVGTISQSTKYVYDAVQGAWRYATLVEQTLGFCSENLETNDSTALFNGSIYKCETRNWVRTSKLIVDTDGWIPGTDGDLKIVEGVYFVFDEAEGEWREASELDYTLGLNGCTTNRTGEMGPGKIDFKYYVCSLNHLWMLVEDKVAYNTLGIDCDEDGKFIYGLVDVKTRFVCDAGEWRDATIEEEQAGESCTAAKEGRFNKDSSRICDDHKFRYANIYDFEIGQKKYFNPDIEYGKLYDERDGRTYNTVEINGLTIMAENLNYADERRNPYLIGHNLCYHDDTTNCLIGGRYYSWTAAVDIDPKWQYRKTKEGMIKKQHRGICPDGWHVPTEEEWWIIRGTEYPSDDSAYQAVGNSQWKNATNEKGLSVLPAGMWLDPEYGHGSYGEGEPCWGTTIGKRTYFWTVSHETESGGYYSAARCHGFGDPSEEREKTDAISLRCIQDYPED